MSQKNDNRVDSFNWHLRVCEIFKRRVGNGMLNFRENDGGLSQEQ